MLLYIQSRDYGPNHSLIVLIWLFEPNLFSGPGQFIYPYPSFDALSKKDNISLSGRVHPHRSLQDRSSIRVLWVHYSSLGLLGIAANVTRPEEKRRNAPFRPKTDKQVNQFRYLSRKMTILHYPTWNLFLLQKVNPLPDLIRALFLLSIMSYADVSFLQLFAIDMVNEVFEYRSRGTSFRILFANST